MTMKLLLLGADGKVGWELRRALAPLGEVVACARQAPDGTPADFSQPESLAELARRFAPDVIVNAAAHTAVDKAESEPELAHAINAAAPGVLAREAAARGAWLLHFSTDYVFDGSGEHARDEDAPTAPLNAYGRGKLEGERLIRASGCRHLILSTSWVYAARGGNFARTMLRLGAERDELRVIDDQIGAPTGADLLADVSAHALRAARDRPALQGTYHCVADGQTSWHGYARFVIDWALRHGQPLRVAPPSILPVPSSAYATAARRPLNSRLSTARLRRTFGLRLPPWQAGVERMLREICS
jgi:dTDP-4-dehydrorhamnose reductase